MNVEALLLYGIYAVVAFGWRTWLQWRRTGDMGLRLHAPPGSVQWWAKLGFVAALGLGLAGPIAGLAGVDPIDALDSTASHVAGTVLAIAGVAATALAQLQMGASWRVGVDQAERTALVTHGVFSRVRNPIYTGMLVAAAGFMLMVGNVVAVIAAAALVLALEVQVRLVEEPYLRATHGAAFQRYARAAGRFLPGVGRVSAG